jgi:hypothetical protein
MGVCARTERVLQIKNQDFGVALGHDVIVDQKDLHSGKGASGTE